MGFHQYAWLSKLGERVDTASRIMIYEDMCRCLKDAGFEGKRYMKERSKISRALQVSEHP